MTRALRQAVRAAPALTVVLAGCGPFARVVGGGPPRTTAPDAAAPGGTAPDTAASGAEAASGRAAPNAAAAPADAPATATVAHAASALDLAEATHEYPSPPVRETVAAAAPDPASAVRAFARAYVNWSAATVAADMRDLAAVSVGQARSAMELAAAQTAADGDLRRGGIANHGTVAAVAPLPEAAPLAGGSRRYVVVTEETTTATRTTAYAGLGAAWHVTLATATALDGGGWVVSGWQPES